MTGFALGIKPYQPAQSTSYNWSGLVGALGDAAGLFGVLTSAVGSFYDLRSQQASLKSQALSHRHQQAMSQLNAAMAEDEASRMIAEGQRQESAVYARGGALRGARRASQAASGVQLGYGSAAEVAAADEIGTEIQASSVRRSTAMAAAAARNRSVNYENQALMAGVSADNLRRSAGSISPALGLTTSLIGGASTLSRDWRYRQYGYRGR